MELNFDKFQFVFDFAVVFAIMILMQTDIFIPLTLVLGVYLAGTTIDNVSTYFCAKMSGMTLFFFMEENIGTQDCVKKYGLIGGLIATEFRPKKIFCEFTMIVIFGFIIMILTKNIDFSLGFLVPGLLFISSQRIYAGLSNLNIIREEYKLYYPNKLIIEEEQ